MTDLDAVQREVARALLAIGAVVFTPRAPVTFKSGIASPVYVDNRRLPFWPEQWRAVLDACQQTIAAHELAPEIIAGIEAAGIPHSAALGYAMRLPSVFVRKQAKEHGLQGRIEGGDVRGRRVLLVEDMVTTGGSSLAGVAALRDAGAVVDACLCITTYGFAEARAAFEAADVRLYPLAPFAAIVAEASAQGRFGAGERAVIEDWLRDPRDWADRQAAGKELE